MCITLLHYTGFQYEPSYFFERQIIFMRRLGAMRGRADSTYQLNINIGPKSLSQAQYRSVIQLARIFSAANAKLALCFLNILLLNISFFV